MSDIRVSRIMILAALAVLMLVPASAAAQIGVGVGFGPYWGPYGYPYAYAPPGPYGPYPNQRPVGEVQIKSPDSKAEIYINGSLIGRAQELKRMYLKPGTYDVEQHIGSDVQKHRVYVLAYRTVKVQFGKPGTPSPQPGPPPAEWSPLPQPLPAPAPAPPPAPRQ